nr:MAG TPA: hypothetical protein [Crassvirales sp.]
MLEPINLYFLLKLRMLFVKNSILLFLLCITYQIHSHVYIA